jgi:hypothetical protein
MEIIASRPDIPIKGGLVPRLSPSVAAAGAEVAFEDISLAYDAPPVLSNEAMVASHEKEEKTAIVIDRLSLRIRPGERVAIVGLSGTSVPAASTHALLDSHNHQPNPQPTTNNNYRERQVQPRLPPPPPLPPDHRPRPPRRDRHRRPRPPLLAKPNRGRHPGGPVAGRDLGARQHHLRAARRRC